MAGIYSLKKLKKATGSIGYEMLDALTIPFDRKDPDVDKSSVTVGLKIDGPVGWKPADPRRKTWDPLNREIVQVCCHIN